MLAAYSISLDRYPYLTKCFTTGTLFGIADTITQFCNNTLIQSSKNVQSIITKEHFFLL